MTSTKINGLISFASNSPGVATGYGQQAEQLIERMLKSGLTVAAMSNYGHEGGVSELKMRTGKIPHYPRSFVGYSDDVLPAQHAHFKRGKPDMPSAIFTLYDAWVYQNPALKDIPMISWVPVDHLGIPPKVLEVIARDNVTPIAMAPNGSQLMDELGIENHYIPHGINTKIYKPTETVGEKTIREYLGLKDEFLVGMVAANKAAGQVHRKAFAENLLAFAQFQQKHKEAVLYMHTDPSKALGGFDLVKLLKTLGIPGDNVIFPDPLDLRFGVSQEHMAGLYSAFDVFLAPSLGEGFGVPTIEAQACGTRAIASNWTASKHMVSEDGWLVDGYPLWDEPQSTFWKVPSVPAIINALEQAYESPRGTSKKARDFALQFDADKIYKEKWEPFFRSYFAE